MDDDDDDQGWDSPMCTLRVECGGGASIERRERVGNVIWRGWKMCNISCWSVRDGKMNGWTFFRHCLG